MKANAQKLDMIEHLPTIHQCQIFDLCPCLREHLVNDFLLESNPSGRLYLCHIQIVEFSEHEMSNAPRVSPRKVSMFILLLPLIQKL